MKVFAANWIRGTFVVLGLISWEAYHEAVKRGVLLWEGVFFFLTILIATFVLWRDEE